jgi:hypothetical protein
MIVEICLIVIALSQLTVALVVLINFAESHKPDEPMTEDVQRMFN